MKCTKFHQCSAPLCPLWEEWLHSSVWTVGEEICTKVFPGGKVKKQPPDLTAGEFNRSE